MFKRIVFAAMTVFAFVFANSAAASIIGETVKIDWLYPNSSTTLTSSGNVVVGAGVEWDPGYGVSAVDIGDGTITIQNDTTGWAAASFNGFQITDILGGIDDFTSFSLISSNGLDFSPVVTFSANVLSVNFTPTGSVNYQTNGTYVFSFTTASASVPEPSSILLMGAGLVGLTLTRRRKNKG